MKIGNLDLIWKGHSSFFINSENKIYIDPYKLSGNLEKADIIFLTHSHYDHCSPEDIKKIVKKDTIVVLPADCQSKVARLEVEMRIMDVGEAINVKGVKAGGVPAYNLNKKFHPKGERWLGYIIKVGDFLLYHAGDTDYIPEMKKLKGINVALLPVSGTYTMSAEEAAEAASVIRAGIFVPMHYGSGIGNIADAEKFVNLCRKKGLKAEILEKN